MIEERVRTFISDIKALSVCLSLPVEQANGADFKIIEFWANPVANEYKGNMIDDPIILSILWINALNKFSWHVKEIKSFEVIQGFDARGYLFEMGHFVKFKIFKRKQSSFVYEDRIYSIQPSKIQFLQFWKTSTSKMQNLTIIGIVPNTNLQQTWQLF